jgi:hypothetical protein
MQTFVHLTGGAKLALPCSLPEAAVQIAPAARNASGMCTAKDTNGRTLMINPDQILYLEEYDQDRSPPFAMR